MKKILKDAIEENTNITIEIPNECRERAEDDANQVKKFSETLKSWRYNPNFTLTPETLEVLHRFFADLDVKNEGIPSRKDVADAVRRLDVHNHVTSEELMILERGYHGDIDPEDSVSFEEFCSLVVDWQKTSPRTLEMVYYSWLSRMIADFSDGEGSFISPVDVSKDPVTIDQPNQLRPDLIHPRDDKRKESISTNESEKDLNKLSSPWYKNTKLLSTNTKSFIAGGCAGMISKSCLAPIDRVKILFQVTEHRFSIRRAIALGNEIYTKDGFRALFRGNSATVLRVYPYAGIQHSSFDFFRRQMMEYNELVFAKQTQEDNYSTSKVNHSDDQNIMDHVSRELSRKQLILAGSLAGGLSVICTYPLDVVRARLVVHHGRRSPYNGIYDAMKKMYRAEGLASFSRGLTPTLMGVLPYTGIGFALNEQLKQLLLEIQYPNRHPSQKDHQGLSVFSKFSCSYFAACIAQSATYPLDTVRRRIQTYGYLSKETLAGCSHLPHAYTSIYQTARTIVQHEGIRGLYKGLVMNWMRSPVATGISLTAYDVLKELLGVQRIH